MTIIISGINSFYELRQFANMFMMIFSKIDNINANIIFLEFFGERNKFFLRLLHRTGYKTHDLLFGCFVDPVLQNQLGDLQPVGQMDAFVLFYIIYLGHYLLMVICGGCQNFALFIP